MKRLLYILPLLLLPLLAAAQTMNVRMKDGNVKKFKISEVDCVDFTLEEEEDDEIDPVYYPDVVKAEYTAAFISKFGYPSPNQRWGFYTSTTRGGDSGRKFRVIAEDLVSNDFDFNDVVFDIEEIEDGINITLLAVGTTIPMYIYGEEVHGRFGVGTDVMVNIGPGNVELSPVSFKVDIDFSSAFAHPFIQSFVRENVGVQLWANAGESPAMIAVNTDYEWCEERKPIDSRHPDFVSWVQGSIQDWYTPEQNNQDINSDVVIGGNDSQLQQAWNGLYYQLFQVNSLSKSVESKYTGIVDDGAFKAPVNPSNQLLNNFWTAPYTQINRSLLIQSYAEGDNQRSALALCDILDALAYEELMTFFGDVPYLTKDVDPMTSLPRTSASEIIDKLILRISQTSGGATDRGSMILTSQSSLEELSSPSLDLANLVLAELYLEKGDYQTAKQHLSTIINSGHYAFQSITRNELNSNEIIFLLSGFETDEAILRTYSDVLLLCAECENALGNVAASKSLISQVVSAKNLEVDLTDPAMAIAQVRRILQDQTHGYFAYLKRSELAQESLHLEDYQLLLPIPYDELLRNPNITQNLGY